MARGASMRCVAVLVALAGVGAGCGQPGGGGSGDTLAGVPATEQITVPSTSRTPATDTGQPSATLPAPTMPDSVTPVLSLAPVQVAEPCPEQPPIAGPDAAGLAELSRLEPMLATVLGYATQHADQFGAHGLIWHDGSDGSVVVSFTDDVDVHRTELTQLVEHSDELIVCQSPLSRAESETLFASLSTELQGQFVSVAFGGFGALQVRVPADAEALAADLDARYSDSIELTVGALRYPLDVARNVCAGMVAGTGVAGVAAAIVPPEGPVSIPTGIDQLQFEVELTNTGDSPVQLFVGTGLLTILDGAGNVVNGWDGVAMALAGLNVDLVPGASARIPAAGSVASCDPALGYELPPGEYQVVASVSAGPGQEMVTPPIAITFAR